MQPATRGAPRAAGRSGKLFTPRTAEDAVAFAGWAVYQLAKGKITSSEAKAMMGLLKEFREALQLDLLMKARERKQTPPAEPSA